MQATPVIAIFDIGKTNKKLFLFDEYYQLVYEETGRISETVDEDGDPCEDLAALQSFVFSSLQKAFQNKAFKIKAVNFSAYGASFVNLDEKGQPVTPLYNYLKTYPGDLLRTFYDTYGGKDVFSVTTASPVMGHLNSGMQLYWLKHAKPSLYKKVKLSLHLPQYISYLLSAKPLSELTSIGCHTNLWDFSKQQYHEWVSKEGIDEKLAPIVSSTQVSHASVRNGRYRVGVGLHDSSAALIPYLASFHEPFILISTGTWCISLNPFNQSPLTYHELQQDCLCYLTYQGKPVKASRIFAGNEHEQQTKRIAEHFNKGVDYYKTVRLDMNFVRPFSTSALTQQDSESRPLVLKESMFVQRDLSQFDNYEEAYHQLIQDIVQQQVVSTGLVLKGTGVKRLFVDGGFSKNPIYMYLLATAFPELEIYAASMAQATAMGAALAIHSAWNSKPLPSDIIELKYYGIAQRVSENE